MSLIGSPLFLLMWLLMMLLLLLLLLLLFKECVSLFATIAVVISACAASAVAVAAVLTFCCAVLMCCCAGHFLLHVPSQARHVCAACQPAPRALLRWSALPFPVPVLPVAVVNIHTCTLYLFVMLIWEVMCKFTYACG